MPYKNIDIKRAHARLYYWLNKDKIKNGMEHNRDNRNKRRRDYYKNNRATILTKHKEWREKDGNKYRRYERKKIYYEEHKQEISSLLFTFFSPQLP